MITRLRLEELLPSDMLAANQEHIRDFLLQEGITPDPEALGRTVVSERQIKELLAELADDLPG